MTDDGEQVLAWYAKGRERVRRATVGALEGAANAVSVGLLLDEGQERWPVLRVGPDGIDDIGGCAARRSSAQ